MDTLTLREIMLYCPKCKREYKDGSQRFCNNDGGRLLPSVTSGKKQSNQQKGVFTSLLGKSPSQVDRNEKVERKAPVQRRPLPPRGFEPPSKSKVFKSERILSPESKRPKERESEADKPRPVKAAKPAAIPSKAETPRREVKADETVHPSVGSEIPVTPERNILDQREPAEPVARLIDPSEIASGRAPLGDPAVHPTGREAVSFNEPDAMVGEVVKGRYRIIKTIGSDQASIAYLAEDTILKGKKAVVRVLMKSPIDGSFEDKIFLEERVSLSHVDHPNVAKVIDSGELPEGKAFIVTSELRENSVENLIFKEGDLNPLRIARIVRQASYALSEVHQNGILHRNLKPEDILLTVSEAGIELVKVTDFCVSDGKVNAENFRYKAPEQIGGQLPTFASDSYSLAVIAYRLLTRRFPFEGNTEREVLAAQKTGLTQLPSELNDSLNATIDAIFLKALEYEPSKRFAKSRDFGEVLFLALTDRTKDGDFEQDSKPETSIGEESAAPVVEETLPESITVQSTKTDSDSDIIIDWRKEADAPLKSAVEEFEEEPEVRSGSNETLWQNRSPEPKGERGVLFTILSLAGLLVLVLGVIGVWSYFFKNANNGPETVSTDTNSAVLKGQGVDSPSSSPKVQESDIETPPPPRQLQAPPNTIYFENSKSNLSEAMSKKFRGFSLYYPEAWKRNLRDKAGKKVDDKFLDVAISNKDGIPIEHFMISPYDSNGTFKSDIELFPNLVAKSNKDISGSLEGATYKVVAEGSTTIQDRRWKAYEVNFELEGKMDDKPFFIWGRRLWIPVQRPGVNTGFIITMLATSLSKDVKKADDVGKQGDLKQIVQTFEPLQDY